MLQRFYAGLLRLEAVIAGALLVLMVLLIFSGGVARSLGRPINWTIDLSTCFFAWACFLAADVAWRKNAMMAIDVVTNRLPERVQQALRYVNYALIAAFLVYLIVMGVQMTWVGRARAFQGIPWISYSWVTVGLPVGAMLLLISTGLKVRAELRRENEDDRARDVL